MKSTLSLSLLTLFLAPTQIGAIAIALDKWQAPNGHKVTIIRDFGSPCSKEDNASNEATPEEKQQSELIAYLRDKQNLHLIAQDMYLDSIIPLNQFITKNAGTTSLYLTGMVELARINDIDADSIEFKNLMLNDEEIIDLSIKQCSSIEDTIPTALKNDFETIEPALKMLIEPARHFRNDNSTSCIYNFMGDNVFNVFNALYKDDKAYDLYAKELKKLQSKIIDYIIISHTVHDSAHGKETYVCMKESNTITLNNHLKMLGYKRIFSFDFIANQIPNFENEFDPQTFKDLMEPAFKSFDEDLFNESLKEVSLSNNYSITYEDCRAMMRKLIIRAHFFERMMNIADYPKLSPERFREFVTTQTLNQAGAAI